MFHLRFEGQSYIFNFGSHLPGYLKILRALNFYPCWLSFEIFGVRTSNKLVAPLIALISSFCFVFVALFNASFFFSFFLLPSFQWEHGRVECALFFYYVYTSIISYVPIFHIVLYFLIKPEIGSRNHT